MNSREILNRLNEMIANNEEEDYELVWQLAQDWNLKVGGKVEEAFDKAFQQIDVMRQDWEDG